MKGTFALAILGLTILSGIGNYYIGLRFWQSIGSVVGVIWINYYWTIYLLIMGSYFLGRIGAVYFPGDCSDKLIWAGSYCLGMAFYLCLVWLCYDMGVLFFRFIGFVPPEGGYYSLTSGIVVLLVAGSLVTYGAYNARKVKIRSYQLIIQKQVHKEKEFHVVMVSDLHLGLLVGKKRLEYAVKLVNGLKADVVLLVGDIIDENIGSFIENGMPEVLCGIRSKFGVFGVLGSHEYIYGHAEKTLEYLKQSGIKMLRDTYVELPNGVYLVGRDDLFRKQFLGTPRKKLSHILQGCKDQQPIILMDHQPVELAEAQLHRVDLQLSGHTHHGQFFPLTMLTQWFFEIDWGYLQKGMYQLVVSSGYGTWGPPIRLGTSAEIVDITIKFIASDKVHNYGESVLP